MHEPSVVGRIIPFMHGMMTEKSGGVVIVISLPHLLCSATLARSSLNVRNKEWMCIPARLLNVNSKAERIGRRTIPHSIVHPSDCMTETLSSLPPPDIYLDELRAPLHDVRRHILVPRRPRLPHADRNVVPQNPHVLCDAREHVRPDVRPAHHVRLPRAHR